MFPNDYQGMAQMMAWRELQRMRDKRKEENGNGDGQALMHLTYCCLCKLGLVLSKCGKVVEAVGQRVAWYAISKKAENAPWHYH